MPLPADLGAVACLEFAATLGRFADAAYRRARDLMRSAEQLGKFAGALYVQTYRAFQLNGWAPPAPPNTFSEIFRDRIVTQHIPPNVITTSDAVRRLIAPMDYHWPLLSVRQQRGSEAATDAIRDALSTLDAQYVDDHARKQLEEIDSIIAESST